MTAQRLRDAARGMREKAEGATPGPWEAGERCVWSTQRNGVFLGQAVVFDSDEGEGGCGSPADADYIAAMHPAVALAVADLLDSVANDIDAQSAIHNLTSTTVARATALADAFLAEAAASAAQQHGAAPRYPAWEHHDGIPCPNADDTHMCAEHGEWCRVPPPSNPSAPVRGE